MNKVEITGTGPRDMRILINSHDVTEMFGIKHLTFEASDKDIPLLTLTMPVMDFKISAQTAIDLVYSLVEEGMLNITYPDDPELSGESVPDDAA